jgi:hypothetical protein
MVRETHAEVDMSEKKHAHRHATIGDLRRSLRELGDPWSAPKHFDDEDPLPEPPRGAQPIEPDQIRRLAPKSQEEFEASLREVPLTNPFLIARRRELGPPTPVEEEPERQAAPANDKPEWGVA